ncbi:MAG TPA: DUF4266 domain-containing protein [Myxococcota bacterium]|nr:DUF4266 domain-containing protein [Myxococcota bacterium]
MLAPALLLALAASATACTSVAPWERGRLAKPQMALDPDPLQRALRDHVHASREAAAGGTIGAGGGCGCD